MGKIIWVGGPPSNKPQTQAKISTTTFTKPAQVTKDGSPKPIIDKLTIVWTVPTAKLAQELYFDCLHQMSNDSDFFKSAGKPPYGFQRAKLIPSPSTGETAHLAYNYNQPDKLANRFRIELNPSRLGLDGLMDIHGVLGSLLPNGFRHFVVEGKITRIDIALDLVGVRLSKIKVLPLSAQSSAAWSGASGKPETLQWGKTKGNHTQVYNKTLEQAKKGVVLPGPQVTRVERRFKNPPCKKLSDLPTMANPFMGLVLTDGIPPAPPSGPAYVWPFFCDSVAVRGLDAAVKLLPKHKRPAYRQAFLAAKPTWWNPEGAWAAWPETLASLNLLDPKAWT